MKLLGIMGKFYIVSLVINQYLSTNVVKLFSTSIPVNIEAIETESLYFNKILFLLLHHPHLPIKNILVIKFPTRVHFEKIMLVRCMKKLFRKFKISLEMGLFGLE
ncbi:uncharacterized protein LOC112600012 [Melanaphis sacchari]|uniref:uncharacterized protein LOC112600012 n=1 Tax=Melanaphis sacchari TaxID=742174 RepID=UPI000DC13AD2|nr:uncharacterized protein LOC112600012 [Melanaphis sacchari]